MADKQQVKCAVEAILAGECTQAAVAEEFGISRQAVSSWIKKYRATGQLVEPGRRGRAKVVPLAQPEKDQIETLIKTAIPGDFGIDPADEWRVESIRELLFKQIGRRFSRGYVFDLMAELSLPLPSVSPELAAQREAHDQVQKTDGRPTKEPQNKFTIEYMREKVAEAQEQMAQSGLRPSSHDRSAQGHGRRSGKHALGTAQKNSSKRRKKNRRKKAKRRN